MATVERRSVPENKHYVAVRKSELDALEAENAALLEDLSNALGMLADWCVAVDEIGTGWDDWDEHYKDAMFRDGPLRAKLDLAIVDARNRHMMIMSDL